MPDSNAQSFNILAVGQAGRLGYEAVVLAASLRASDPGFAGRLIVMEPQSGGAWPGDPRLPGPIRALIERLGAEILPFEARHFGAAYPQGNKIEALLAAPDVAMTEAAIGSGLTTFLFFFVLGRIRREGGNG